MHETQKTVLVYEPSPYTHNILGLLQSLVGANDQ